MRGAVLAVGVLAAALVAVHLVGTPESATDRVGQSPALTPQEPVGVAGVDVPSAPTELVLHTSQPAGRDRVTSLEVRDGWGHPQPGVALRLTPPNERRVALELVADSSGVLDLTGLGSEPEGDAELSAVDAELIVLTGTLAEACALGHILISTRMRVTGVVRLADISPEDAAQLLADLQCYVVALPELTYTAMDDRIRIYRALARRGLAGRPVAARDFSVDLATGRFELSACATPQARLVIGLQGWAAAAHPLEVAVLSDGDIGEVVLGRHPSVQIRVSVEEGVSVPARLSTTTWRSGPIGDVARADALASFGGRGGFFEMVDPLQGRWTVGSTGTTPLYGDAGSIAVPRGFIVNLVATDQDPDVLSRQVQRPDGEIVFELYRADHEPDVQVLWHGDSDLRGQLTILDVDHPAQINRRISLDPRGRVLSEHFEDGRLYGVSASALRVGGRSGPGGIRFLNWTDGKRSIKLDELPTRRPTSR